MNRSIEQHASAGRVAQFPVAQAYESGVVPIRFSGWPAAQLSPAYAALDRDLDSDVVVIGAGLAGASLTLHLAEKGIEVVLLEADQPASGASGRNAGHVQPYLGSLEPLRAHADGGRRFLDTFIAHRGIVFDLCRKHGLEADAAPCGMLEAAIRPHAALERQAQQWKALGYDLEVVGADALRDMLGSPAYRHGIHWREGGRVNPYLFTHGLVAAAVRGGARVYGNSCVLACEREGARWRVRTATGSVRAARVVICTNGHAGNAFFPELNRTQFPLVACGLATRPLPKALLDAVNPARVALMQYPAGLYPLVIDGRGRLVTATIPGPGRAQSAQTHFDYFLRYLRRTYPALREAPIELESYWTGMTANSSAVYEASYPKLFQVADGVLALMNLGSWGNVMGPLLGMSLAGALAEDRPDAALLPLETPRAVRFQGLFETKIRRVMIPVARLADRLKLV
ncbi:NAD(P)/FAD-dependent oxidoreductase [Pseudomonas panipatensis]|uniref:Glycine/D-amino acid oxidase n=1 Tax=Pseudomonas panipatensis TaxID=428992 RepID=A0A1G8EMD3_9PSED|nr:FAD-dependent oxidoreductase [Pseudomonas panipatensis]SDH70849.1 Glycine/D-amino acid oxidase [Pseudomonas panipatensis]SMP68350.1 Glycine/D-amino acid oxidase [Pseudomonas panipatensis]